MKATKARSHRLAPRCAQGGFSMVEMAVALVVAGLMSWAAFTGYETVTAQQEIERGRAEAQQLQSMLRAFAMRHGRLPCPGVNANGYESLDAGGDCAAGTQVGWFPYVSTGLEMPTAGFFARYSVYRGPTRSTDFAVADERTGDAAGTTTFRDVTDLIVALNAVPAVPAGGVDSTRTYLTGDAGAAGVIDCAANASMAAAYWIIVPLQDRDGDGNRFDAPHVPASVCAASPSAPLRFGSDDVVIAESPAQLAGWLRKSMP